MTTIDLAQLDRFGRLQSGWHDTIQDGMSIMEAVSYVAGEPWSSNPACASPVLGEFLRIWGNFLPDDERDMLLRPLIPRLVGTRSTPDVEDRRALMAADWLVRVHTPAWLRLAKLDAHADVLAALPEIVDRTQASSLRALLNAAEREAVDARSASRDKTWNAAADAAWLATEAMGLDAVAASAGTAASRACIASPAADAAWDAASDMPITRTRGTAWMAARLHAAGAAWHATWGFPTSEASHLAKVAGAIAAWHATWDGAWDAMSATQHDLQQSALRLVDRMIDL